MAKKQEKWGLNEAEWKKTKEAQKAMLEVLEVVKRYIAE